LAPFSQPPPLSHPPPPWPPYPPPPPPPAPLARSPPLALLTPPPLQILALRGEKAKILGFKNFSDLSMASKVRGSCGNREGREGGSPPTLLHCTGLTVPVLVLNCRTCQFCTSRLCGVCFIVHPAPKRALDCIPAAAVVVCVTRWPPLLVLRTCWRSCARTHTSQQRWAAVGGMGVDVSRGGVCLEGADLANQYFAEQYSKIPCKVLQMNRACAPPPIWVPAGQHCPPLPSHPYTLPMLVCSPICLPAPPVLIVACVFRVHVRSHTLSPLRPTPLPFPPPRRRTLLT